MTNKYYAPVILERFSSRQLRKNNRRSQFRRLAAIQRHNVLPIDGPAQDLAVGKRAEELAVFDDKAANDVILDAEAQIKSGYPTIATSTLVKRNPLGEDYEEAHTTIRFFSELVKPVKYRWKFQKERLKTLSPSKQGFHPRSQSPTFQRLVEANEKLSGLVKRKSGTDTAQNDDLEIRSELNTDISEKTTIIRYAKSEGMSITRGTTDTMLKTLPERIECMELRPDIRGIDRRKTDDICFDEDEDDDDDEDYKSQNLTPKQYISYSNSQVNEFKVDFKKMDSHSELHLFLPQIEDTHSRLATPDNKHTRVHINKVALPNISHTKEISDIKTHDDDKTKQKKSQKSEFKKKKKKHLRVKSGNEDKEVRDRLNDVPTLISLENERPDEPAQSICVFDNCPQHLSYRKSSKIRQA